MDFVDLAISDRVAWLTLNRPDRLNAIDESVMAEFEEHLDQLEVNTEIRVVVIKGAGNSFCVGLDLEILDKGFQDSDYFIHILHRLKDLLLRIENLSCPVVAAVDGIARAGGLELLLTCDIVVVTDTSQIGDNHTNFGVMPGGGATARLPKKIGDQNARDLIYSGRLLNGHEAVEVGLALQSVPSHLLQAVIDQRVQELVDKPRDCHAAVKRAILGSLDKPVDVAVEIELSEFEQYVLAPSSAAREGYSAYREGRTPDWKDM